MPALPPVPQVLQVLLHQGIGSDEEAITKLHFKYTGGPPDNAALNAVASDITSLYTSHLAALAPTNGGLLGVTVTDLTSSTSAQGSDATLVNGTRTGGDLSSATAVLVNYGIARRYRGGKPRSYFPFFTATDMSAVTAWVSGSVTAAQTGVSAFLTAIEALTSGSTALGSQVNVSYFEGFTTFTTPSGRVKNLSKVRTTPVVDSIVSVSVNPKPASQRRRNLHSS